MPTRRTKKAGREWAVILQAPPLHLSFAFGACRLVWKGHIKQRAEDWSRGPGAMTKLGTTGGMRGIDDSLFAKVSQTGQVEKGVCSILPNKCHANWNIPADDRTSQYGINAGPASITKPDRPQDPNVCDQYVRYPVSSVSLRRKANTVQTSAEVVNSGSLT